MHQICQESLMTHGERTETVRLLFQTRCGKDFATNRDPFAPTEDEAAEFLRMVPEGRAGLGIAAQAFSNVEKLLMRERDRLLFYSQDEVIDLVRKEISKEVGKHKESGQIRTLFVTEAWA